MLKSLKEIFALIAKHGKESAMYNEYFFKVILKHVSCKDDTLIWMNNENNAFSQITLPIGVFTQYHRKKLKQELSDAGYEWFIKKKEY